MLRAGRNAGEVEALAPHHDEVRILRESRGSRRRAAGRARRAANVFGFLSARISRSSSRRSPGCGSQSGLTKAVEAMRQQPLERRELLVRAPARHERDGPLRALDQRSRNGDGRREIDGLALDHRLQRARTLEDLREIAALVADPRPVDFGVFARRHALDADVLARVERVQLPFRLAMPDVDRAAARAAGADGGRGLQVPDAGLVQERAARAMRRRGRGR